MAKKKMKFVDVLMWVVGILVSLAIGDLFTSGETMRGILGLFPLIVHQIVGWVIYISTGLAVLNKVLNLKLFK